MISEQKLDFWVKNNLNVLFTGKPGVGKTAIIKNTFMSSRVISFPKEEKDESLLELKMAARKGIRNLPQEVIDKMYGKHRKGPDDKEYKE